jgi:hypothetical protein
MNTAGKTLISIGLALAAAWAVWLLVTVIGSDPHADLSRFGEVCLIVGVWVVGLALGLALYFLPTVIAWYRDSPIAGSVTVVNLFLGWTFIGWVVSLAMAVGGRRSQEN